MNRMTTAALVCLAGGIFTSVTVLSVYQILFTLPLLVYSFRALKSSERKLPPSSYFLLIFVALALMSLFINLDIVPKPSKNFGRIKYFLYGVGGIFVLRVWLFETSEKVKKVISNVFLISIIVAGAYAFWRWFYLQEPRVKSFTDTMRYGYGTGMVLLILLGALLHSKKLGPWFNVKLGVIAFFMGFLGMYLTHTRGALLGFLCGLPFVVYYYRAKWGLILGTFSALIVAILAGFYFFNTGHYESRFLQNKNNGSDVIRRSQWKAAVIATEERPFLGWGFSNFHSQLKRIKETHDLDAKDYNDAHAHNLFLEIAAGTGLIGLVIFLAWLLSWAMECFKAGGMVRALIIPFGVAFVVCSQFEVTFDANNASMIFFLYALSSVFTTRKTS